MILRGELAMCWSLFSKSNEVWGLWDLITALAWPLNLFWAVERQIFWGKNKRARASALQKAIFTHTDSQRKETLNNIIWAVYAIGPTWCKPSYSKYGTYVIKLFELATCSLSLGTSVFPSLVLCPSLCYQDMIFPLTSKWARSARIQHPGGWRQQPLQQRADLRLSDWYYM